MENCKGSEGLALWILDEVDELEQKAVRLGFVKEFKDAIVYKVADTVINIARDNELSVEESLAGCFGELRGLVEAILENSICDSCKLSPESEGGSDE